MPFTLLSDSDVQSLLLNLTSTSLQTLLSTLSSTLKLYSTTPESTHQPPRSSITRESQSQITLFMPSTSPTNVGVKIVGLPMPGSNTTRTLECSILICDAATGKAQGVLNAAGLTAFRTSLGSMIGFNLRNWTQNPIKTREVVMFGSGKQAFWHLRLALLLKNSNPENGKGKQGKISKITIVNRSRQRAEELITSLSADGNDHLVQNTMFSVLELQDWSSNQEYATKLQTAIDRASAVFCAVPTSTPLFPAKWIKNRTETNSDLYISAIGSYRLDMQELDPELLKWTTSNPSTSSSSPTTKSTSTDPNSTGESGRIIVDSIGACFHEAGEIVSAGLKEDNLIEIGKVCDILDNNDNDNDEQTKNKEVWHDRLSSGLIVYKSVGIGVMDLCMANAILELSKTQRIGVVVDKF